MISHPSLFLSMPRLKGENKKRYDELRAQLAKFDHLYHSEEPMGSGMRDLGPQAPPTHVLAVGNYARQLEEVEPGFLTILDPEPAKIVTPCGLAVDRSAHRAGKMADRSGESADGASDGEPALASSLRCRYRGDARRFRTDGTEADASRTSRLAEQRIRTKRLELEAYAPADGDVECVPAEFGVPRRSRQSRSVEPVALALPAAAPRSGVDSR